MSSDLRDMRILVTGGAGFIGSNLVAELLDKGAIVRVLDNLSTGKMKNIEPFMSHDRFSFIEGDITNPEVCLDATKDIDAISHQAALGSVPRSIANPLLTHNVNATGFLNMMHAAHQNKVKRFVFASSSSVYGDSTISPKTIGSEGNLLSPYAVTKELNEQYAKVFHRLHQMETIGLRYFNVFGPNQDPNGVYAAAIPKFIAKMMNGEEITVHGDGEQTRDFTYVKNAVQANVRSLTVNNYEAFGRMYNVACGEKYSLNHVIGVIKESLSKSNKLHPQAKVTHGPDRPGDIRNSLADIHETTEMLGYSDPVSFSDGMTSYLKTY